MKGLESLRGGVYGIIDPLTDPTATPCGDFGRGSGLRASGIRLSTSPLADHELARG